MTPETSMASQPLVVVGVDGSPGSLAALAVALDEARRRGATLRIVTAWHIPNYVSGFAPPGLAIGEIHSDMAEAAHKTLAEALGELPTHLGVPVETCVVEGYPADALIAASRRAELLVVGRRGRNRFSELVLGSTSRSCVEHAPCPVLVVPRPACEARSAAGEVGRPVLRLASTHPAAKAIP
jgi:nucleotide-binding universal stress UspA family protein